MRDQTRLDKVLLQCTRYCGHPTFDNAGVYNVNEPFRAAYANRCFEPAYPELTDGGFPLDP